MSEVVIRQCEPGDTGAIHELYGATFGRQSAETWKRRHGWQFFENPAARVRPSKFYAALVDGRLQGFVAAFPVRLKVGGAMRSVLSPCDLMVAPEAAGYNLGYRLLRACMRDSGGQVNALGYSPAAGKLYDSLKFKTVPVAPSSIRPLDLGAIGIRAFRTSSAGGLMHAAPVARAMHRLGAVATALSAAAHIVTQPRMPRGYTLKRVTRSDDVDEAYDDLWKRVSKAMPVVGVRDRSFVQWRFLDDPVFSHSLLEVRDASRNLRGYAASCVVEKRGLRFGKIMDLFCDPSATDVIDALHHGVLSTLREQHAGVVVLKGLHARIRKRMGRFIYLEPRNTPPAARIMCAADDPLVSMVYEPANWHVSHADGDDDFSA